MRKILIVVGIIFLLLIVGLSGCIYSIQVECKKTKDEMIESAIQSIEFQIKLKINNDKIASYEDYLKMNFTFDYKEININITKREGYCIGNTTGWLNCSYFNINLENRTYLSCNFYVNEEYDNVINSSKLIEFGISDIKYDIPDDLDIEYSWNNYFMEPHYSLFINSTGYVIFEEDLGISNEQKYYNLTNEELFEIYNEIIKNNFFELNATYNPEIQILDGFYLSLRVNAKNKESKVNISNVRVNQIDNITEKIIGILTLKDEELGKIDII